MGVEFCPDFGQSFFEKLGELLIDTAVAVLGNMDSLAQRDLAVAGWIFYVTTHAVGSGVGDVEAGLGELAEMEDKRTRQMSE
jgi:hypothetical protein